MRHFLLVTCRYAANIEKIDYESEKVLIHYRQWSHRYDEWFDWTSPYLRPVERVQLRKKGAQGDSSVPVSLECCLSSLSFVLHKGVRAVMVVFAFVCISSESRTIGLLYVKDQLSLSFL